MINKEFIEKIEQMSLPKLVEVGGREYSTVNLSPVKRPLPDPIAVHTLTGLVDYVDNNPDQISRGDVFIHIDSFRSCRLLGGILGDFCERDCFVEATADQCTFHFNRYQPREEFQIGLMAFFEPTPSLSLLLQVVGNTLQNAEINLSDDGVTQRTTTRNGIARKAEIDLPNPIVLKPYATFVEVDQPEISYVFRMREGGKDGVECALFDADGNRYKLDTVQRIKDYLREEIQGIKIIV